MVASMVFLFFADLPFLNIAATESRYWEIKDQISQMAENVGTTTWST